ncbi:MAG: UDP-N-acetylmuramoyl-L-alanyl-D-glutamate--2,6-diaminopimelate ligase [Acidimicrobiia bacterium]|nr:UDP-N-acetylmuramoyl-L-alanyl-D-glutamate--2,6-diaminopimelate ligase [Acidimicrobiia bacterium]
MTGVSIRDLSGRVGGTVFGDESVVVADVRHDSRDIGPGDLFVAVVGFTGDGHDYVPAAVAAGASALCVERPSDAAVPQVVVESARVALGPLAAAVHGEPSHHLPVVGVTGTNGKTTVTHLLTSIVLAAERSPGLIGTIGARIGDQHLTLSRTTPEASDLQRLLATMRDSGVEVVAMEVSSHALVLHRTDATRFAVAAFTNLSQDHLDFHGDMESYYVAKRSLFDSRRAGAGVISVSDDWGLRLAEEVDIPVVTTGIDSGAITARNLSTTLTGSTFDLDMAGSLAPVTLGLPGRFNVENALIAAGCASTLGIDINDIATGLSMPVTIPGRYETIDIPAPFSVVVDYAHTPEAIERIVADARAAAQGRVIVVVGAGGDRDRAKRPEMGSAAATADVAIVTTDNPRSEDPERIISEVAAGAGGAAVVVVDRRDGIRQALELATDGDVVLVLGKGHETTQEIDGSTYPFDDRKVVHDLFNEVHGG